MGVWHNQGEVNIFTGVDVSRVCIRAKRPVRLVLISNVSGMKQLGVFYFSTGWDTSPLQGYLQHSSSNNIYFIYI